jgi:hypothetical protein
MGVHRLLAGLGELAGGRRSAVADESCPHRPDREKWRRRRGRGCDDALRTGLADLGYAEGHNLTIEGGLVRRSFDNLVGAGKDRARHREAERYQNRDSAGDVVSVARLDP